MELFFTYVVCFIYMASLADAIFSIALSEVTLPIIFLHSFSNEQAFAETRQARNSLQNVTVHFSKVSQTRRLE